MSWEREQQNGNGGTVQWEYFVNQDKSASRLFDELCRGLAQVIRRLEPISNHNGLSPPQLSNFYRSCGGNYDELFKNTGENGLSWIYRTLGCYHSLQPTRNAFEAPSIPCLTEDGFVRWQTLQLLLCPQEQSAFIQKAVERYDVPRTGGGFFPKRIPQKCFPARPDAEMEKWHRFVTSHINQEPYMRRLKYSPYTSPQPEGSRSDGYFTHSPHRRKPSGLQKRASLSEEEMARREAVRRRSSVPDVISPRGTPYSEKEARYSRSHSAHRPDSSGIYHHRQRSSAGTPTHYYSPPASSHRPAESVPARGHGRSTSMDQRDRRRGPPHDRNVSSGSGNESADDASSEESYHSKRNRSSEEDNKRRSRWGSSLMPSFFLSKNQRRHSSDGRVPTAKDERRPQHNDSIRKYRGEGTHYPSGQALDPPPDRTSSGVRFEEPFKPADTQPLPPHPDEPAYAPPPSSYRFAESQASTHQPVHMSLNPNLPNVNQIPPTPPNGHAAANYYGANPPQLSARKQGLPVRVATVSGVNGRRYAPVGTQSTIEPIGRRDRTYSMKNPATSTVL